MSIAGKVKELKDFSKQIGIFEAEVVIINPSREDYKEVLNIDLDEESKAAEYLGESKDGNQYLRVSVWLKNVKTGEMFSSPITFFLEDKNRENKDGDKLQYINNMGTCTWADDPEHLPDWFTTRPYRVAKQGEEELYEFLHTWLGKFNFKDENGEFLLDWKKLMKGNVSELSEQIGGEYACTFGPLATVITREKENEAGEKEIREYQGIYNKAFLPAYSIKNFRLVDYSNKDIIKKLQAKKLKELKPHEKFVLKVTGEYGCKDAYVLKDLKEYVAEEFITGTDKVIDEKNSDY